jgi:dienelactone hydrolase
MGMSDHCTTDRPLPSSSTQTPTGEITQFNDVDVYISKPPDYPHSPSKLLLLLTSGTGIRSTNNQLQADRFASEGFVVVVPDQFAGDPAPNTTTTAAGTAESGSGEEHVSVIEQVKLRAAETVKSFMIDMWLARHTPEKVLPILHRVLESTKDEFADAVANGGGVYAAGYCFGGKYVLMLAAEQLDSDTVGVGERRDEEEGMVNSGPLIKAGAVAHATLVTREDLSAVKAPVSLVCVGT